jgi:hypothetical protein
MQMLCLTEARVTFMAFRFSQKPEIRLSNPPLNEVVCQVKFPPVLRIGKESPSDLFNTRLRWMKGIWNRFCV